MTHDAFISHPGQDLDIVENLAEQLGDLGIKAWVYSQDRTLMEDLWSEIEEKINICQLFIFVASKYSLNATGQHKELRLAIDKFKKTNARSRMLPVAIGDIDFGDLPEELRSINGLRLDAYNVKSVANEIALTAFPNLVETEKNREWKCPQPGQWLEVCNIGQWIEEPFDIGDPVYFRRLSPLGLFECYSPKIDELYWLAPHNLRATNTVDEDGTLTRQEVPHRYRYATSIEFEMAGMDEMSKR